MAPRIFPKMYPLMHLFGQAYSAYHINEDGRVFSTKQTAMPIEIGRCTSSVMMNNKSYTKRRLLKHVLAADNTRFVACTRDLPEGCSLPVAERVSLVKVAAPKQDVGATAAVPNGWIIGSFRDTGFSFDAKPRIHTTRDTVKPELARLAQFHPGVKFVSLSIEDSVQSGGLIWN